MSDTLAARLREAYLGTDTGDAVPFDELKPAVCDRWQRVADAARVPCAVPGYEPSSTPIITDLHKQLEAARREVDEVRRHISVTMSREHQARKEAQEAKRELAALHPGETVEGVIMERDHYRIRLERADADLRECAGVPAGWELDVTAVDMWNRYNETDEGTIESMQAVLDLCRSRIRPVFERKECANKANDECKWCAKWQTCAENVQSNYEIVSARLDRVRAALEGE